MERIFVTSPVKADGKVYMPGAHEVDAETAAALEAAGAIGPAPDEAPDKAPVTLTAAEVDQLVATRAEVIAETIVAVAVERAVTALASERDEAVERAKAAEDRLAVLEAAAKDGAKEAPPPETMLAEAPPRKGSKAKG